MPDRIASTRPENRRGMSRGERRAERRGRSDSRKRRKRYIYTAIGSTIALLFIGSLLVPGGAGSHGGSANANLNTGGPVSILDDQGRGHIEPGTPGGAYFTQPAASGAHWISNPSDLVPTGSPARWGTYGQPLGDEVQIHNLEHGGIVINYRCEEDCVELVAQLETLIPASHAQFILAPYPEMDTRIAIVSWRHLLQMDEFDADRVNEFIDAYLDRAPESVPGNLF